MRDARVCCEEWVGTSPVGFFSLPWMYDTTADSAKKPSGFCVAGMVEMGLWLGLPDSFGSLFCVGGKFWLADCLAVVKSDLAWSGAISSIGVASTTK